MKSFLGNVFLLNIRSLGTAQGGSLPNTLSIVTCPCELPYFPLQLTSFNDIYFLLMVQRGWGLAVLMACDLCFASPLNGEVLL